MQNLNVKCFQVNSEVELIPQGTLATGLMAARLWNACNFYACWSWN